jgi:hypothetical protein
VLLICRFGTSRAEIRSVVVCLPLVLQRQYVHFKNTTGHHPRSRKESPRHPKSSLHRTLAVVSRRARPPTSRLLIFHLSYCRPLARIRYPAFTERRRGISRGPRCGRRKGPQRVPGRISVCIPLIRTTRKSLSYSFTHSFTNSPSLPPSAMFL